MLQCYLRRRRWSITAARMITPLMTSWASTLRSSSVKMLKMSAKVRTPRGCRRSSPAAGQAHAADDDRGDRVELVAIAVAGAALESRPVTRTAAKPAHRPEMT